jgi:hypothetical protein
MIYFDEFSNATTLFREKNVTKIIVPLCMDTLKESNQYKSIIEKYPDVDAKFTTAINSKTYKPGDFIKIQSDGGYAIFFVILRNIEKFQGYLIDFLKALDKIIDYLKREITSSASTPGSVVMPLPTSDELKLSESIVIPAIADKLNIKGIDVYVLTNSDYESYIERITEDAVYYKQDSWKSDWMLTLDDILLLDVIDQLIFMLHDYKISKSNFVKIYYFCHENGMFPKIEFYETEYGKFFKMFLLKTNALINHGLVINKYHYSNQEPKKFSCIFGPMWPNLRHMAYTRIMENREKTAKIANEVRQDYFASFKKQDGAPQKQPYQGGGYKKPDPSGTNLFGI